MTSRFVALLDEKAGNPTFQPPEGTNAQVHFGAAILLALGGYAAPQGRTFNLEKEKHMAIFGKIKIRGLVMAPALFALVAGISPMAQAQDDQSGLSAPTEGSWLAENHRGLASPIEGSWIFAIDTTGLGTFNSLISFTAGGVVITSPSVPGFGTLYGSWKQTEPNCFKAAFYGFISEGAALTKSNLQLHLTSRNELAGTAVASNCDLQGENCINAGEAQFTGKRIVPE